MSGGGSGLDLDHKLWQGQPGHAQQGHRRGCAKRTEARANFLAMHDSLTGLPNRSHVIAQFDRAVVDIENAGDEAALVFLDLDHFKDVNDTLGHAAGDELLVHVAARLRR